MTKRIKAYDFLMRGRNLQKQIDADKEMIVKLEAAATKVSPIYSKAPSHSAGNTSDKVGDGVISKVDYEQHLKDQVLEQYRVLQEIDCIIRKVKQPTRRQILMLYYRNGEPMVKVASILDLSRQQVWRLHIKAIKDVQRILDDNRIVKRHPHE